ncbi:MAG: DUF1700 domain-containing protein [Lachnospiraceae bacterium]|nr:DUF1700 domain-containing protein [Lachnospiraceae bacterium]
MNKEEFITQLKQSINILDDQEQQYFVEEYTQHIDMKISQGMTEEEAVKEIGSIEELSKEILESYHVKTDLVENKPPKNIDCGKFFGKVKVQADKIYEKIGAGCKKMASAFKKMFAGIGNGLGRLLKKEKAEDLELKETKEKNRGGFHLRNLIKGFFGFCGRVIRKCFYIALWCMMLMWNCFAIGCGLFGIFLMAICVFMLGVFLVMLVQGYPVIGLTIGSLGACVSIGALTVSCFILTRWKINRNEEQEGGEANA